uniref:Uncharacterized protein n=1 Tax=Coccidioides posadasii RMSCC 3488 TaxID=454284 RepID=A0A0J6FSZ8_COCPO|nr:hypothetical protein CPAG_08824 [Coccidioides posadasii RMSCC 3488]
MVNGINIHPPPSKFIPRWPYPLGLSSGWSRALKCFRDAWKDGSGGSAGVMEHLIRSGVKIGPENLSLEPGSANSFVNQVTRAHKLRNPIIAFDLRSRSAFWGVGGTPAIKTNLDHIPVSPSAHGRQSENNPMCSI